MIIQGQTFFVQLHVQPLGGCDLVLGTQWLNTLGIINWDFKHLTMGFQYGSNQIVLQGIKTQFVGSKLQDGPQFFKGPTRKVLILHILAQCSAMEQSSLPVEIVALLQEFQRCFCYTSGCTSYKRA